MRSFKDFLKGERILGVQHEIRHGKRYRTSVTATNGTVVLDSPNLDTLKELSTAMSSGDEFTSSLTGAIVSHTHDSRPYDYWSYPYDYHDYDREYRVNIRESNEYEGKINAAAERHKKYSKDYAKWKFEREGKDSYKSELSRRANVAEAKVTKLEREVTTLKRSLSHANSTQSLLEKKIDAAIEILADYGQVDEDHHKAWVINEVAKVLLVYGYDKFVREYCDGEDGPNTYEWNTGIAP